MQIPFVYNLRSVTNRPVSTALTALGIGLVVAVFVAMLALANGFVAALVKTGSSDNVLLLRKGAALVAICADRIYPSPRGLEFGVGATAAMFAYAANVTPTFCGKPESIFFTELCRRLGFRPEGCVLVGDNLESDIEGATRVGMSTILTLSGISTRDDLRTAKVQPGAVVNDLTDLL